MSEQILSAKLYIPPPRSGVVPRRRLLDRLDAGLRSGRRLTAIVAPAGCGKTTLVTSWVYSPDLAVASHAVAWLSLDEGDNDPARFFAYLIAALHQFAPAAGRAVQTLLAAPQHPPATALMTGLIGDLAELAVPGLLILDDYQVIVSSEIHEALVTLVTYLPPQLHLVVISREPLPLPVARMRVRDTVTEITGEALRFTEEEAKDLFRRASPAAMSGDVVGEAVLRTEGWAAGLQLLALAVHREMGRPDAPDLSVADLLNVVGGSRHVTDYLVSEIVLQQAEDVQAFLRATSILDHLSGSLCDYVAERLASEALLAQLAEANLFVVPLDDQGHWYRYHRLFAEVLVGTLGTDERAARHRRAQAWYEAHDMPEFAVRHALTVGKLTGDWQAAEHLVRRHGEGVAQHGEMMTVGKWLDALPEATVTADPYLTMLKAWILAMVGDLTAAAGHAEAAASLLQAASLRRGAAAPEGSVERQCGVHGDRAVRGKLQALRAFIALLKSGDNRQANTFAEDALSLLSEQAIAWRVLALWSKAEANERLDHLTDAIDALWEAQRLGRSMRETLFAVVAEGGLLKLLNDHGRRRDALAVGAEALAHYRDADGAPLPLAGYIHSHLGLLEYEANDLEAAVASHRQAVALGEALGLDYELIYQRAMAAPTWHAIGQSNHALAALRAGYQHAIQDGYADADWFLAWEATIHLWSGDFVSVRHWAEQAGLTPQDTPHLLRIEQHVMYARYLIAERRHAEARQWLARLEAFTRENHLYRWLLTVNVQQAVVADRLGDRDSALGLLSQAIRAAAPEGYVRVFLVEDGRVVSLVDGLRPIAPDFVDRVIAQAEGHSANLVAHPSALVEPLTARELEVVRLIARGATNQEIAETLVIAHGTVKRHTNHIYGKLQVHNRTEAAARARELGYL